MTKKQYAPKYPEDHEYSRNPLVQIEEEEQRRVAESDTWLMARWSTRIDMPDCEDTAPTLKALGFQIIRQSDFLFYEAVPPDGWTKTTEGYWTTIYDDRGTERGQQFYKGAVYDRRAHLHIE